MIVSFNDSPFWTLVPAVLLKPITLPPRSWMAVSKLSHVLDEGSNNKEAITLPFNKF
jgi:hypothetical protein